MARHELVERSPFNRCELCAAAPVFRAVKYCGESMELRSRSKHFAVGAPNDLPLSQLPTNKDVINFTRLVLSRYSVGHGKDKLMKVYQSVATEVAEMWTREGIPIMSVKSVVRKVTNCYAKFRNMTKLEKSRRDEKARALKFQTYIRELFDIALCKCRNQRHCRCPRDHRVPPAEVTFLKDQRGPRRRFIGELDVSETRRRRTSARRRQKLALREGRDPRVVPAHVEHTAPGPGLQSSEPEPSGPQAVCTNDGASTDDCDVNACDDNMSWDASGMETADFNFERLTNTALAADRFGLSNRAVAAIINGFQEDIGRITENNTSLTVDPKKVWRERNRLRLESAEKREHDYGKDFRALYFDGRKDLTAMGQSTTTMEEHVAVVAEPGGQYIGHFTPETGRAMDQAKVLDSIANTSDADVSVLGCDGAAVNTGRCGGVCRLLELCKNRPLHWFICQLHGNELNLREVFRQLDGETTGPKSFSGPLGKAAGKDVHRLPVNNFQPVSGQVPDVPDSTFSELSNDQQLLYTLAQVVKTGNISEEDAGRKIGPLNHARYVSFFLSK